MYPFFFSQFKKTSIVSKSCPLLLLVASCLPSGSGCHVASHHAFSTLHHLLLCHHLTCPSLTPHLHLQWLVVALHLIVMLLPPVLSSAPPPANALPPHIAPATPPQVCLLFATAGCRVASCGNCASHPPACPPFCLCLWLHLILVCPS
jgi:hypothetical protein